MHSLSYYSNKSLQSGNQIPTILLKLKYFFRYVLIPLSMAGVLVLYSCSTKKNTLLSRTYHNITTHYNIYWNGNESFKTGMNTLKESVADNYNSILKVYNYGTLAESRKVSSNMDRAIEKAGVAIPRHSMLIKNVEHNRWIDDCYMLIGKAQFYKQDYVNARRTLDYLQKQYPGTSTDLEASIWYIRCLLQQKKFEDVAAQFEQLETKLARTKAPYRIRREIPLLYADYYLLTGNYQAAKTNLTQGLALASDRKLKARINFILGQIAQQEKNFAEATRYYTQVIKSPASYEMVFNARINLAKSFDVSTGNKAELEKQLGRMLKDTKNKEYYDQVYYALAEMAALDKNDTLVIYYLKRSVANSSKNNYQKSTAALQLADMFFIRQNYEMAAAYYDTTIQTLPLEHPDYTAINTKTLTLTELVKNLRVVQYEDSLQKMAKLPEAQLMAAIKEIIDKKNKEEEQQNALMQQQLSGNSMMNNIPNMRNENIGSVGGGGWYFYNPSAISFGFSEFLRKWGRRKLEDNWRLSNKRPMAQFDETTPETAAEGDSTGKTKSESAKTISTDPKKPETYLAQLPKTKAQLDASNARIASALLNLGYIYKDGLNDVPHSVESFEELIRRFPEMKDLNRIYYQLYLIGMEKPDAALAARYKDLILSKYPDSEYAQLIKDPDYNKEVLARKNRISSLYEETYQAFEREQFRIVILYSNQAIAEYTDKDLIPRFEYLRAIALGKTASTDTMVVALNKLVSNYPTHPITPLAKEILQKYDKTKTAVQPSVAATAATAGQPAATSMATPYPAQSSDTLVPDIYKLNLNTTHFYLMMIDGNKFNVNATKTRISDFVAKEYLTANLSVNAIVLDGGWQMISISSFRNGQAAMDFYNAISKNAYVNSPLANSDYKQMVISIENYPIFYREKKYNGYLNFFRKYYLK